MRISDAAALALAFGLAGCGGAQGPGENSSVAETLPTAAEDAPAANSIACAIGDATDLTDTCLVEQAANVVTLRHPDGGFRRFAVEGGTVKAADGAEPVEVRAVDDMLHIAVGGDEYQLPAAIAGR